MKNELYIEFKPVPASLKRDAEWGLQKLADDFEGIWYTMGNKYALVIPCEDATDFQSFMTSIDFIVSLDEVDGIVWKDDKSQQPTLIQRRRKLNEVMPNV